MPPPPTAAFGTLFASTMATARWSQGTWEDPVQRPTGPLEFHPATHVFHYGSACFEGLKAHRGDDGVVRIFRAAAHVERMRASANRLRLPQPPADLLSGMIDDTVRANRAEVPDAPGSMYIRPTLIGTEVNIGAAAVPSKEALLYILNSPVGDYFSGGIRPLRLAVETEHPRTTPQFGRVKSGANYVMALGITMDAKTELGVDQVLFAPDGHVQETGAANFLLMEPDRIITPALSDAFLHGVTRDSILTMARDRGMNVEERDDLTIDQVLEFADRPQAEAALAGTAAVLASVGTLIHRGEERPVGSGEVGPVTLDLRSALTELQSGRRQDAHGWLQAVG